MNGAAAMQYFEPNFVDEALVLLDRFAPGVRVLAGGTLLGPSVRADPSGTTTIVNVKRIPELREIHFDGATLHVGALATAHELANNALVRAHAPLLGRAAGGLGATQLRNVATVGGNLRSGHPSADIATALLACDARCRIAEITEGPSTLALTDLLDIGAALSARTLITAIEIPSSRARVSYLKMQTRRAFEMALVSVAVATEVRDGAVAGARVALGGAGRVPLRALHAERVLQNARASAETAAKAARIAASDDADPASDEHASADYRRHLVAVLTERALLETFDAREGATR